MTCASTTGPDGPATCPHSLRSEARPDRCSQCLGIVVTRLGAAELYAALDEIADSDAIKRLLRGQGDEE